MIRDRGRKKWTSLMLPEHVELLKELWDEENQREKPILEEQMKEFIEKKILNSYVTQRCIGVKYYKNNQILSVQGKIIHLDQQKGQITFQCGMNIQLGNIISVL